MLTKAPVLAFHDVTRPTAMAADASSYGLGAVLLQLYGEEFNSIQFNFICIALNHHYSLKGLNR